MSKKFVTTDQKAQAARLVDRIGVNAYRDAKRAVLGSLKPFQMLTYEEALLLLGYLEAEATEKLKAAREAALITEITVPMTV